MLASAGPVRPPGTEAHLTGVRATASRHRSASKRARERQVHREAHRAVRECMRRGLRRHYGEAALQSAAHHLPSGALEYTECDRELRSAELRVAAHRTARVDAKDGSGFPRTTRFRSYRLSQHG